jgi:hypothetical protein
MLQIYLHGGCVMSEQRTWEFVCAGIRCPPRDYAEYRRGRTLGGGMLQTVKGLAV